jgi:peptide chain release factor 2
LSEQSDALQELDRQLESFASHVDVGFKRTRIDELEQRMSAPGFWDDQATAQSIVQELKALKNIVEPWTDLRESVDACRDLLELAAGDDEALADLNVEINRLREGYDKLEVALALGGPYDDCDIYLSIQSGAGGTDANDWAEMMLRMYSNYCEREGYGYELIDVQPANEAGIRSATMHIKGDHAYGYLKSEMGTHRLVRMSPFNSSGTRETSFAAVEVTPELPETETVNEADLDITEFRIDTYRASGAGGQHVNKTDSAVRITHLPTNVVVSCQTERSQVQNKARCWKMMVAKLQQLKEVERLDELKDLAGERGTIGWGHQIRSYVLQPTQLITDLRTRLKEGNAQKVLDGDLQEFIDAYLKWRLSQGAAKS